MQQRFRLLYNKRGRQWRFYDMTVGEILHECELLCVSHESPFNWFDLAKVRERLAIEIAARSGRNSQETPRE